MNIKRRPHRKNDTSIISDDSFISDLPKKKQIYKDMISEFKEMAGSNEDYDYMLSLIEKFEPKDITVDPLLKPFIPQYITAVGQVDSFIKVPRPDNEYDDRGLHTLDEHIMGICQTNNDKALSFIFDLVSKGLEPEITLKKLNQDGISSLYIKGNNLDKLNFKIVQDVLSTVSGLDLEFSSVNQNTKVLADVLISNKSISELHLNNNNIGPDQAGLLAKSLFFNQTLTHLDLGGNRLGDCGVNELCISLTTNITISYLDLGSNRISDDGAYCISNMLAKNKVIKSLHLNYNKIGDRGSDFIASSFSFNSSMISLDLGGNKIGDIGAAALGLGLQNNNSITNLELDNNNIENSGAEWIAYALTINRSLESLDLKDNKIGDEGVKKFCDTLKVNTKLIYLDLENNLITNEGALAFSAAFNQNKSLLALNLDGNNITKIAAKSLFDFIISYNSPTELCLTVTRDN